MSRPREQRVDEAVLPLALAWFFERGVDGISVADLAAQAGVSRQSVYRRWRTKEAIVLAAIDAAPVRLPVPTGRGLRERLAELFASVDLDEAARRSALMVGRLAVEGDRHPAVTRRCGERFVEPRRDQLLAELEAGVRRGELRADVDLVLLSELLTAPLMFGLLPPGRSSPADPARVVDLLLAGAAAGDRPG
ncbi:MAG: TetR/AcrR family transcriptional regulator [Kineosporiaceae bacterium]